MVVLCAGSLFKALSLCKNSTKPSDNALADALFPFLSSYGQYIAHVKNCSKNLSPEAFNYFSGDISAKMEEIRKCCRDTLGMISANQYRRLVATLLSIIRDDGTIYDDTVIGIAPRYQKRNILRYRCFEPVDFFSNLLIYVCRLNDNLRGREGISELNNAYMENALREWERIEIVDDVTQLDKIETQSVQEKNEEASSSPRIRDSALKPERTPLHFSFGNISVSIKKWSTKRKLAVAAALLTIMISGTTVWGIAKVDARYHDLMGHGKQYTDAGDYLVAAGHYHSAAEIAAKLPFHKSDYTSAACKEGNSYLLAGLIKTSAGESDINNYYGKAAAIFEKIKIDRSLKNCDSYVDALCGLSAVYMNTGHFPDKEWADLIETINSYAIDLGMYDVDQEHISEIDEALLKRYVKISFTLVQYCDYVMTREQIVTAIPVIMESVIENHRQFQRFFDADAQTDPETAIIHDPIFNAECLAEILVLYAVNHPENYEKYALEAIELCDMALNNPAIRGSDADDYVRLNILKGQAYRVLGDGEADKVQARGYFTLAHDTLTPLLSLSEDSISFDLIITAAYDSIFTRKCSKQERETIFELYTDFFDRLDVGSDPSATALKALNICDACRGLIEIYGYSEDVWNLGKRTVNKLALLEPYVQFSHRMGLQEFRSYFQ